MLDAHPGPGGGGDQKRFIEDCYIIYNLYNLL